MASIGEASTFQALINLIKSKLGTAAYKDIPSTGDAGESEVVIGSDSRLSDSRAASDVYPWAKAATKPSYTANEVGAIPTSQKGVANGVAGLDANGLIPQNQLPASLNCRYNIVTKSTSGTSASITVNKYVNGALDTSTDYTYKQLANLVNIDGLFTLIYSNSNGYIMTLINDSTTHSAGYSTSWRYNETVDLVETFAINDKGSLLIAPMFSDDTSYAVGDYVTYMGDFCKCTTPHPAGPWDPTHFTATTVDDELDTKMNKSGGIMTGALTVQGDVTATVNNVTIPLSAAQLQALSSAITINGSQYTTVEDTLNALNLAKANTGHNHQVSDITDFPTLPSSFGTAASKDVPTSGDASTSQVVMGNDTRLTNSRAASDVYSWAKAATKPSYSASEVGALAVISRIDNDSTVSTPTSGTEYLAYTYTPTSKSCFLLLSVELSNYIGNPSRIRIVKNWRSPNYSVQDHSRTILDLTAGSDGSIEGNSVTIMEYVGKYDVTSYSIYVTQTGASNGKTDVRIHGMLLS